MSDAIATIERLLAEAEQLADPQARNLARALAAALVDLVGDGMRRVVDVGGEDLARKLADDDLVGNLFVLCGMHPDGPIVRARRALETAGKELASVGAVLEGVDELGAGIRVRVTAERGAATDPDRVRALVEAIVVARAPDIDGIVVEVSGKPVKLAGFVPLDRLRVNG